MREKHYGHSNRSSEMRKSIVFVTLWLAGIVFTFVSLQIHAPYLFFLNRFGAGAILVASLVVLALLVRQKAWRGTGGKWLMLLWCLPALSMTYAQATFLMSKRNVSMTEAGDARVLGKHFIIGYSSFAEVETL